MESGRIEISFRQVVYVAFIPNALNKLLFLIQVVSASTRLKIQSVAFDPHGT